MAHDNDTEAPRPQRVPADVTRAEDVGQDAARADDVTHADDAEAAHTRRVRAERRRSAGIYGAVVTAAIFAASSQLSTAGLVVAVVVTLVVYWLAEEYAELLGEQIEAGRLPSMRRVGGALADTWPMVTASFLPLIAAVIARLAGATTLTSANVGLAVVVLLLGAHSRAAGKAAQLTGWRLAGATASGVGLGLVMVLLKNLALSHLH